MQLNRLLTTLALAGLAGCATHSDIQPQDSLTAPSQFSPLPFSADSSAQISDHYWQALGDPQLDRLIDTALADSPSLQAAQARIRRASALTDAAHSALLPQVSAGFEAIDQRYTENGMVSPTYAGKWRTADRLALDAGIELDVWNKYRRALQGAQATRTAAELDAQVVRVTLAASLSRAYIEFDRLHRQQALLERLIALREDTERLQGVRVKAGLDPELDRNIQQQSIAQLRVERAQLEERIGLQRNLLAALAGLGPERGAALTPPQISGSVEARLPSVLPSDLLARRPELLAARWRVEAASRDIDVARAQFYPSVNLTAFLGFNAIGLDNLLDPGSRIAGLGPTIRLPIFEAGRLRAGLAIKAADYDAAVDQYNAGLVDALREVADQARSLDGAQRQGQLAEESIARAERGARLVSARISQGLANRINLLSAQAQVLSQERIATDLRSHRLDAAVGLARALGGGFAARYNPFTLADAPRT